MHDGMQYDLIQGQGQGHEPSKVGNLAIFKGYLQFVWTGGRTFETHFIRSTWRSRSNKR